MRRRRLTLREWLVLLADPLFAVACAVAMAAVLAYGPSILWR